MHVHLRVLTCIKRYCESQIVRVIFATVPTKCAVCNLPKSLEVKCTTGLFQGALGKIISGASMTYYFQATCRTKNRLQVASWSRPLGGPDHLCQ